MGDHHETLVLGIAGREHLQKSMALNPNIEASWPIASYSNDCLESKTHM
jgi:hypothetical protein